MKWKARMVKVTRIPEKKAPVKRSLKTTVTSKAQPALSGKVPDGPVAAPPRAVGVSASASYEPIILSGWTKVVSEVSPM
jgi:hypothetical protein